MNNHTEIPVVSISPEAGYDMLHSILTGWSCRIWLTSTPVILVARWEGEGERDDTTRLSLWVDKEGDYCQPFVIDTDDIRRVEIM